MKLNVLRADPAGNITLFVLDPVEKSRRADVAAQLMAVPEYKAEQVGFVCTPQEGGDGRMEMMGGEFCGNATRAFGLLTAKKMGAPAPVSYTHLLAGVGPHVHQAVGQALRPADVDGLPVHKGPAAPPGGK